MRSILRRLAGDRRGVTAIEFALTAPIVITALIGIVEFGRFFYVRSNLQNAVYEAGRYHVLNPTASSSTITTQVRNNVTGIPSTSVTVVVANETVGTTTFKKITATATFSLLSNMLPRNTLPLSAVTRVPMPPTS